MISTLPPAGKKYIQPLLCAAVLAAVLLRTSSPCKASEHPPVPAQPVVIGNSSVDAASEARNILHLAKLALESTAPDEVKKSFDDEIARVDKNHKLKEAVVVQLLQGDPSDPDPSLPKVQLATYKDGVTRALMFIQSDAASAAKPQRIAWMLDSKKGKKESPEH